MTDKRRTANCDEAATVLAAAAKAVAAAIAQHKRDGDPIVVWENGSIRWIPAHEIPSQEIDVPDDHAKS